ncbi:MAG: FlbA protein-like protein [Ramlibacter sp.]|nr:FlbA protein-like protein [Ramlibacter sp.]
MDPRLLEAQALLRQGQPQLAEILLRQLLAAQPRQAQALAMLGALHQERGNWDEALACFDRALAVQPGMPALLNVRGLALKNLGRMEEALASYEAALALKPDFVEAINNRAVALKHLGRLEEAVTGYRQALALKPDSPELHNNLGFALHGLGRYDEAAGAYRRVLEVGGESSEALMNLGVTLYEQYRFDEALKMLDRALALRPDDLDVQFNRANVLLELGRFDEAMNLYGQVRAQRPDDIELLMNIANALRDQHRFDEALATYGKALEQQPDDPGLRWNRSLCLLAKGDFAQGWAEYEWRWKAAKLGNKERRLDAPKWLGQEDLRGKTLLVHSEQGLGDSIQMSRYVRVLAGMGARVVMQVQGPVVALLQRVEGVAAVIAQGADPGPVDFHCPTLSLPLALGTLRDTIPSPLGSLSPDPALVKHWREKIGAGDALNVGLIWSGNPSYAGDHRRSFALPLFRAALPDGPRYWCLQKDIHATDEPWMDGDPPIARFDRAEFVHTAAQIAALDLVIGADTGITHLAAALGTPTWFVVPFTADFRWSADSGTTPWYPGARLFRQARAGDWEPVLAEVKAALQALRK